MPTSCLLLLALLLAPGSLLAQENGSRWWPLPVRLTAEFGLTDPHADYAQGCEYVYLDWQVEARTRGRWFAAVSGGRSLGGGGVDVGCLRGSFGGSTVTYTSGGLELEDATRASLWTGRLVDLGPGGLEAKLGVGMLRGRNGYPGPETGARWLPWVGGAVGALGFGDHLVVSFERAWVRLPFRDEVYRLPAAEPHMFPPERPAGPPEQVREYHLWRPLGALRIGLRL